MTPPLVQEPLASSSRIAADHYVFVICQHGVESTLKSRWIKPDQPFRLAFSRPGLVTLKISEIAASGLRHNPINSPPPADWMIRLAGTAIGQVRQREPQAARAEELVEQALELAGTLWTEVHVFARDAELPGIKGFEPGPTPLCDEIGQLFKQRLASAGQTARINVEANVGDQVLDIVLVEPTHWLVGHHTVRQRHEQWPGGAYPVHPPAEMISRAYLKMAEALAWSGLPIQADDWFVEIGSAPGGACQRLLDLGLNVTGIDPAEMDPVLLAHPRFEHWRNKSSAVRRKNYAKFRWLAADANVAPNYTLDAVEDIVTYPTSRMEGLLLTLKLSSYELCDHFQSYVARVRGWGFPRVEIRQLASNRRECCLVAQR